MDSKTINAQRAERHDADNNGRTIRLLVTTCHGEKGAVVRVSQSRARDLIADGRAVES